MPPMQQRLGAIPIVMIVMPATVLAMPLMMTLAITLLGGCGDSALDGGFDARQPAGRLTAIGQAARADDRSPATLRRLVEQLDSDDEAVRLAAIGALERLTGETHGYRYDDPRATRSLAIDRWERDPAVETGQEVGVPVGPVASGADRSE